MNPKLSRFLRRSRAAAALRLVRIRTHGGALATYAAMIAGWLLITQGVASKCAPGLVWPVSLGLLCCSLGGWQLIYTIARYGAYALHVDGKSKEKR